MNSPKFIAKPFEERFEYHLPTSYNRFLAQTVVYNSLFGLENEADLYSFISNNNISDIGWNENSILYTIALKTLAHNKKCLIVYFDDENAIFKIQPNSNPIKVEWWHSLQFMEGDTLCEIFGFQNPEMFLKAVNYSNKDLSDRYFYVCEIDYENIHKYTSIYNSDVTNWFFIFCDAQNIHPIISILSNKNEKPNRELFLSLSSSIVNIQIGSDEGYLDYVLIQSKVDINNVIKAIEEKQLNFMQDYESLLKDCNPFEQEWKVEFYKYMYLEIIKKYC